MTVRLVAVVIIAVGMLLAAAGGARGSCARQSGVAQQARAQVIVDGVILAGANLGKARLRVSRYLKGSGPRELVIVGGSTAGAASSNDIEPSAGERWRIFGALTEAATVFTTVCDGSARVEEFEPVESVDPAPATAAAPVESGDGARALFVGLLAAVGTAGLLGVWLRRSGRSERAEPDRASARTTGRP